MRSNKYKTKNMNLQLFAGNAITDLTGTTWQFNSNITATAGYGQFDVICSYAENEYGLIEGADQVFTTLYVGYTFDRGPMPESNSIVWMSFITPPTKFTIGGGSDATNINLISWLKQNATQIVTGYSSTINLTNCTCNKNDETGLSGSYSATITADNGYYLSSVTSELGTVTIAENKKSASIEISDVTENFTIIALGTAIEKLDIILHPNANGVTDYTKEILPKVKTASTLDINRLFRTEYIITKTIINGSASGDTTIWSGETAQVTITPDINYALPSTITVTNANNTYNNTSGVVNLSNATGNVIISGTCESSGYSGNISTYTSDDMANMHRTKIKFGSQPSSENDYDCYVDEYGNFTGSTTYLNETTAYIWGYCSVIRVNNIDHAYYIYNKPQSYDRPYNSASLYNLTSNYTIYMGYGANGNGN